MKKSKYPTREVLVGATREARRLGVSYQYLWKVLTGTIEAPAFLLKIRRLRPSLLSSPICRIDWVKKCREAFPKYEWDNDALRYRLKRSADRRCTRHAEGLS